MSSIEDMNIVRGLVGCTVLVLGNLQIWNCDILLKGFVLLRSLEKVPYEVTASARISHQRRGAGVKMVCYTMSTTSPFLVLLGRICYLFAFLYYPQNSQLNQSS